MKQLVTICTVLLVAASAQTPDTTSAERYFPLQVGNVWEYEGQEEGVEKLQQNRVTEETVVGGTRYFRYEAQQVDPAGTPVGSSRVAYVRFDTLSTEIRTLDGGNGLYEIPFGFPLGAPFGSESNYDGCNARVEGGYAQAVEIGDDTVVTSVKTVDTGGCEYASTFAAGIGFTRYFAMFESSALRYARVGGVEYGEPFITSSEGGPAATRGALLEPYPNPARGPVAVPYVVAVPEAVRLEVVDLLGRTVVVLADGVRPAGSYEAGFDTGRLAAGVYVLRLVTPAGTATRRLVVTE